MTTSVSHEAKASQLNAGDLVHVACAWRTVQSISRVSRKTTIRFTDGTIYTATPAEPFIRADQETPEPSVSTITAQQLVLAAATLRAAAGGKRAEAARLDAADRKLYGSLIARLSAHAAADEIAARHLELAARSR